MSGLVFLFVSLLAYFAPAFVAAFREHHHLMPIIVLNAFGGWTFVGWIVALVWACLPVRATPTSGQRSAPAPAPGGGDAGGAGAFPVSSPGAIAGPSEAPNRTDEEGA